MLDLHRRTGDPAHLDMARRPHRAPAPPRGFGWSHTLCHGDLGLWEFLTSMDFGDPSDLSAVAAGLEQRGPVGGLAREAFSPSLMSGLSGVLHTLLRMHPAATLPNPLLLD